MKMNKIFRNKLNKRSTRLVRGNYKTWLKEIKGGLHEWKGVPQPWIGRLNIAKTAVLPKLMDRFVVTAIKILLPCFCRNQ